MSEPEEARDTLVVRVIERAKRHPLVVAVGALVGLALFFQQVFGLYGLASTAWRGWRNPHAEDYRQLAELDLGLTPDYLENWLGEARRSVDLCREIPCPAEAQGLRLTMNLYGSDRVAVRALFVESSLDWYAVTLLTDGFAPPMTWLNHELGTLGTTTYAQALRVPGVEPTDVDMFLGPQSSAYVEVVAAGAPGGYRGLMLASAPTGWSGPGSFEIEAAPAVMELNDTGYDPAVAARFRSNSRPNTFGEFVDDGDVVAQLARDAELDRVLLYVFTSS